MPNRLAHETSPYLLQHSHNPVDWYPWGSEAFERARTEDRPILLSVGYSACHWCHVMEHESFADVETADLMNREFVNIKVDREERPDVDALYMQAVQRMTGHGGWPMTVFLTPDGLPFYGGTYYPRDPRPGLPSFRQILAAVASAFRDRRGEVDSSASDLRRVLAEGLSVNPAPDSIGIPHLERAYQLIRKRFDDTHGGFGGAPKFPQPMILDFLLRFWGRFGSADALEMVVETLDAMAAGGIRDHLGGGFHRYSVDARWLVPHFEKMLYDNALLGSAYTRTFQATRNPRFRDVACEILDYLIREMRHDSGGFFSSQDADSEGEEGKFYTWSADEIDSLLGPDEGSLFRRVYDVTESGNWEGRNILHLPVSTQAAAEETGRSVEDLTRSLERARRALYEARSRRVWPARDDKVITSWNALTLHAFAEAGHAFGRADYVRCAVDCAEFLLLELRDGDRLFRTWKEGNARVPAFLEDYALLVDSLLALYRATFDPRWIREARSLADSMVERFWSPEEEMFFDAERGTGDLILRPRDIYDNATPSGTSAAALALGRFARLTGEPAFDQLSSHVVRSLGDLATRIPQGFGYLLCAVSQHLSPPTEVVIVGDTAAADTLAMLDVLRSRYLPETAIALRPPEMKDEDVEALLPVLANRSTMDGKATAFVCRHYSCRLPVTEPKDLETELTDVLRRPDDT